MRVFEYQIDGRILAKQRLQHAAQGSEQPVNLKTYRPDRDFTGFNLCQIKQIIDEVCQAVRQQVREVYGDAAADGVRILYGGSVKAANVAGIMAEADVDGCLVGGASLEADEFGGICRYYDMPVL